MQQLKIRIDPDRLAPLGKTYWHINIDSGHKQVHIWKKRVDWSFYYFREATDKDKSYVLVKKEKGCFSYVGYRGWSHQNLWLAGGCGSYRTFAHEFLHAIGLYHEHNRPDRDHYITVLWDNIVEKWRYAYNKCGSCETHGVPYDGRSVMHYWDGSFGIGSKHTMESKVCFPIRNTFSRNIFVILTIYSMFRWLLVQPTD